MNRELFFSLLLFTFSSLSSFYIYSSILISEQQQNEFLSQIESGSSSYNLLHDGLCVGHARKSLNASTDLIELKSEGSFHTKYLNNITRQDYTFNATFNSLGQLGGSLAKISIGDKYISIGSIEIDPITIKLKTNAFNGQIDRSWSIPGPVEIKKNKNGSFRIEYALLNTFLQRSKTLANQPFVKSVNLQAVKVDDPSALCSTSADSALDISSLMADAYKLLQTVQPYAALE